jgi:hypothetical protein
MGGLKNPENERISEKYRVCSNFWSSDQRKLAAAVHQIVI